MKNKEEKVYILNDIWWFINPKTRDNEYEMYVEPFIFNKYCSKIKGLSDNTIYNIYDIERILSDYESRHGWIFDYRLNGCLERAGYTLSFYNHRQLDGKSVVFSIKKILEILKQEELTEYIKLIKEINGSTNIEIPVTENQIQKLTKVISEAMHQKDLVQKNKENQRITNERISKETREF